MSYELSVIIPVFNVETYIKQCLDSIVNQTFGIENIEVIIVNDCTSDNSMDIVNDFAQKYSSFKIINHTVNKGVGEARNTGLKHVSSDYVTFLDSDDFIDENTFKNSMNKIKDSGSDLLIYNWEFFKDGYTEPPTMHKPNFNKDRILNDLKEEPNLIFLTSVWNKIYHKSLFKYLNFPTGLYEDNCISTSVMINASKIYLNSEAIYYYRKNPKSITNVLGKTNSLDLCGSIKVLFDLSKKYPEYAKIINQLAIKFTHDVLFWIYYYNWPIKDEITMIKKLQESFGPISEEDLELYKSIIYSHFPFYGEDILNLNNYDDETFLAVYKYFKSNKKVKAIASVYIDTGNGFNEENKIAINYIPDKNNKLSFDLSKYEGVVSLRFDPVEGAFSKVKILNNLDIIASNADKISDEEYYLFTTLDPYYILSSNSNNKLDIEFEIEFLTNEDINILFNEKNNIINELQIKPKKAEKKSFLRFIK